MEQILDSIQNDFTDLPLPVRENDELIWVFRTDHKQGYDIEVKLFDEINVEVSSPHFNFITFYGNSIECLHLVRMVMQDAEGQGGSYTELETFLNF